MKWWGENFNVHFWSKVYCTTRENFRSRHGIGRLQFTSESQCYTVNFNYYFPKYQASFCIKSVFKYTNSFLLLKNMTFLFYLSNKLASVMC